MRTTSILSLFIVGQMALFSSCKQTCYECEKYVYCATCQCNGQQPVEICADTAPERDDARATIQAALGCSSADCTNSETLLPGNQVEICDKKKEAEDDADDLEIQGYQCHEE